MDHAKMLVRNARGVELMHNICRHRQAVMMQGRGNARNFVCPLHRWTYDTRGTLIGAPHFPQTPCKSLGRTPLQHWNGLLFGGPRNVAEDLARLGIEDFDFSGYVYDRTRITEYKQNWKTFIGCISRTTMSSPSIRGSDSSCSARTCAGSSGRSTRCRQSG
jgi:choline monooxygenase